MPSIQPLPATSNQLHTTKTIVGWVLACVVALSVVWAVTLTKISHDQSALQMIARAELSNRAQNFVRQTQDSLDNINQISLMLQYQWQHDGKSPDITDQYRRGLFQKSWKPATIGANGIIVSARTAEAIGVNMADLPFFAKHRDATSNALGINVPEAGRASLKGQAVIRFTRRVNKRDGSFGGVVLVSIDPDYLNRLNGGGELDEGDSLSLEFENGVLMTGKGGSLAELAGNNYDFGLLAQTKNGVQLQLGSLFDDGQARLVAWENIDTYPLRVTATTPLANVLAPYAAISASYQLSAITLSLLILSASVFGMMTQLRSATRKRDTDAIQQTFRLAIDGAREAFYIITPVLDYAQNVTDFRIEDCNERAARMAGKKGNELIGQLISAVYNDADHIFLKRFLIKAWEEGFFEATIQMPNINGLRENWLHSRAVRSGERIAATVRNVTQLKLQEAKLKRMANTDALTLLPNRHWLNTQLPQALKQAHLHQRQLALLFIDLDNFKKINDSQGHKAGDEVLVAVAEFLRSVVRKNDQVVRLGGDEFTIILDPLEQAADLPRIASQISEALAQMQSPALKGFRARASIGTSIFPDDATDASGLLQAADLAMYAAKNAGKGQVRHFDAQLAQSLTNRIKIEQKLEIALTQNQLVLYFQPRANARTGQLCSMEALVRWQDPERGLISPIEFIPIAEESELIVALGDWVAHEACAQLARWQNAGLPCRPVSINVSARQLNSSNFRIRLAENMVKYQIDQSLIAIELTESTMIADDKLVRAELDALRAMGIELQIDDFGTGYSSLSQLQRLDIDVLKIDQSFVQALDTNEQGVALCEAMISIGKTLNIVVVAEGVETPRQLHLLQLLGCDEVQGYLISPPLPADQLGDFLKRDSLFEPALRKLNLVQ